MKIYNQDCLYKLKELKDNSVDSIVTDPPYGLSFMGKKWDYDVPSVEIWVECLRVLKSGGHLLSFAGSRTYHRMAVRIEDAGFEIRDQIMWIYGSGFPKSHNIGKAVDKQGGNSLGKEVANLVKKKRLEMGLSTIQLAELGKFYGKTNHGGSVSNWETGRGNITREQFNKLIEILNLENNPIIETKREILRKQKTNLTVMQNIGGDNITGEIKVTKGNSEWEGWGTALKPAHEPIVMARKPFKGTVVNNVLEWGTGGINIDESRIATDEVIITHGRNSKSKHFRQIQNHETYQSKGQKLGRFPANIIFDKEAGRILDEQTGKLSTVGSPKKIDNSKTSIFGAGVPGFQMYGDVCGASRFFYCPKTSKRDRNEGVDNNHPTVKPTDLMLYLIRLVTPKGGITLDPFMGSGSTGKAAIRGGFDFIGIEREKEYIDIAKARIKYEQEKQKPDQQQKLF